MLGRREARASTFYTSDEAHTVSDGSSYDLVVFQALGGRRENGEGEQENGADFLAAATFEDSVTKTRLQDSSAKNWYFFCFSA